MLRRCAPEYLQARLAARAQQAQDRAQAALGAAQSAAPASGGPTAQNARQMQQQATGEGVRITYGVGVGA